jgi:hypothetical protein
MKTIMTGTAAGVLLMAFGGFGAAQAQVVYTNAVLSGCYSQTSISVDTEAGALNRNIVGTLCFDGNGNIVGTSGTPSLTGHVSNTNGTVSSTSEETGTYSVTNSPGDGMGTITYTCSTHAFSVNSVDGNGLAHGFQFMLMTRGTSKKCLKQSGPEVIGGTAIYQGPLSANH